MAIAPAMNDRQPATAACSSLLCCLPVPDVPGRTAAATSVRGAGEPAVVHHRAE